MGREIDGSGFLENDGALRRICGIVVLLNLGYFGVEFAVGSSIGSVSLFADSIDFLEDASLNLLVLVALGRAAKTRAWIGMGLACILLVPGAATLWTAWHQFKAQVPPDPFSLSLAGTGALCVNLLCALLLSRYSRKGSSLIRAAFLSARNDTLANIVIIVTGFIAAYLWRSPWPDLIAGLGIAAINADAALEVWEAARREHRDAQLTERPPA